MAAMMVQAPAWTGWLGIHGTGEAHADEHIILVGPKTIGAGWKDNIVVEPRFFANARPGDIVTVYTDQSKRTAQGAFQNPADWQAISPEYKYFGVNGAFRMKISSDMLSTLKEKGLAIGGHDYRIQYVTLTPGTDFVENIVWKGPSVQMKDDWSANAEIKGKYLKNLQVGNALRLHISKAQPDAAAKLMDITWNAIEPAADGCPVAGDSFTYYINDEASLIKIRLAGDGDNIALRVGGKGYKLDQIGIIANQGKLIEDISQAQRAPKEYVLGPGEIFHGEKTFPDDWSANLRITAEPFQKCTENDVVILSYTLLKDNAEKGIKPQMSFRENKGDWKDLETGKEPNWQELDGNDVVLTFDDSTLDKVKTKGFVVTGRGFILNKISLMKAE